MQAQSITEFFPAYHGDMKTGRPSKSERSDFGARVCALREAAGLSQREVAAQLGVSQPSYALWERNNVALRSDQLLNLAKALGVRVEELLNPPATNHRRGGPAGKLRQVFEKASQLPRHQQNKVAEFVGAFVKQHVNGDA
jgi:transcriptional regulator with XRE-family HTH domain